MNRSNRGKQERPIAKTMDRIMQLEVRQQSVGNSASSLRFEALANTRRAVAAVVLVLAMLPVPRNCKDDCVGNISSEKIAADSA
jgi:hypothetical protein